MYFVQRRTRYQPLLGAGEMGTTGTETSRTTMASDTRRVCYHTLAYRSYCYIVYINSRCRWYKYRGSYLAFLESLDSSWSFPNVFKIVTPFWIEKFHYYKKIPDPINNQIANSECSTITPLIPTSLGNSYGLRHLLWCHLHLIDNKQRDTRCVCFHTAIATSSTIAESTTGVGTTGVPTSAFCESLGSLDHRRGWMYNNMCTPCRNRQILSLKLWRETKLTSGSTFTFTDGLLKVWASLTPNFIQFPLKLFRCPFCVLIRPCLERCLNIQ